MHLVNDVQTAFLQLQAECEKLGDCNRNLLEENQEKEGHIQVACGEALVGIFPCCSFLWFTEQSQDKLERKIASSAT